MTCKLCKGLGKITLVYSIVDCDCQTNVTHDNEQGGLWHVADWKKWSIQQPKYIFAPKYEAGKATSKYLFLSDEYRVSGSNVKDGKIWWREGRCANDFGKGTNTGWKWRYKISEYIDDKLVYEFDAEYVG